MSSPSIKARPASKRAAIAALVVLIGGLVGMDEAFSAQRPKSQAKVPVEKPVQVQSVTSTGQRSGVTAGYVNQLTQNVLPTLVRGPLLERFKATFTTGAQLRRMLISGNVSDAEIDRLCSRTDQWADETFNWLREDVSTYAAERFLFRPPQPLVFYTLPGNHADGYADKWGNCQRALADLLINVDTLMREPSIYPEHGESK